MTTPNGPHTRDALLREGQTCWRRARADGIAWLIDGERTFDAIGRAIADAREQVLLVGWDFHSQVRLWRDGAPIDAPSELLLLLDHVARRRRGLQVHVLCWDFAALYTLERELMPRLRFGALSHRRVHFRLDSSHPLLASQHQKLVVVDDSLAFVGGFDLTHHRWDRRDHRPDDPERCTPSGERYGAFHDVQALVSGPAAAAIGELARERWRRASRRTLSAPRRRAGAWIAGVPAEGEGVEIGLARTLPAFEERPEVREIETLYLEMIRRARRWIYVENQYLTAERIGDALATSLRTPTGPEIVIVGPQRASGWLEQQTMDLLRSRLCARLREADQHGRLRLLHPRVPGLAEPGLNVHAKVMVVDDDVARVGSANLSNRSMGLDSECDLVVDATGRPEWTPIVTALRDDLLAEHLDCEREDVAREIESRGSLIGAIEALAVRDRSLVPIEIPEIDGSAELLATGASVADPEAPASWESLQAMFASDALPASPRLGGRWIGLLAGIVVLVLLAAAWRLTPLSDWLDPGALDALFEPIRHAWYAPIVGVGVFVALTHVMFPVTILIVASGLIFGGAVGAAVAWIGSLVAVASGHQLGRRWLHEIVRRRAGRQVERVSRTVARRGILASAVLRLLPIAPFHLVNLIAGASHVRLRDFVVGSQLALTPGIVAMTWASEGIRQAFRDPSALNLVVVAAVVAIAGAIMLGLRRWAQKKQNDEAERERPNDGPPPSRDEGSGS